MKWWTAFRPREFWALIKAAAADWSADRASRLGAALAYYTTFSIVPLLVVIIGIIGLVFGQEAAQSAIMAQLTALVGEQSSAALKEMIQRAEHRSTGIISTLIAVVTLLVGASGVFGQLQDALNTVWGVEQKEGRGMWGFIKDNFLSVVTVIGTGFLLLVSLIVSTALAAFGKWFGGLLPLPESVLHVFNLVLSLVVVTGLFALIFKVLPKARVAWRDVWVGAALTAVLFTIGKFGIGLYLGKSNIGSTFGAAGSLVIVLVWVYYSALILLYGAEFTQAYAYRMGGHIEPTEDAQPRRVPTRNVERKAPTPAPEARQQGARAMHANRRWWTIAGVVIVVLLVGIVLAVYRTEAFLRGYIERLANEKLPDYQVTIGQLALHPLTLSVDLHDVNVRQRAHREPVLAAIPALTVDAAFLPLFKGTLDISVQCENPLFAATEEQIDSAMNSQKAQVKEESPAWQDTVRAMMPVRASLGISHGGVSYTPAATANALSIQDLEVVATDISNRAPEDTVYPSSLHVAAHLPEDARLGIDGHADFLAKPAPRLDAQLKIERLSLESLAPVVQHYNVYLRGGALDLDGKVRHIGASTTVNVDELLIEGAKVDYVHAAETKEKEERQAKKGAQKAKDVHRDPAIAVKMQHGKILHSEVGFANKAASPDYRVFVADMNVEMENFSNKPDEGLGTIKVTGKFMGNGPTVVQASFRPEKPNPDFDVRVRILKTKVESLNNLLRAYGRVDAKEGTFAFFSEMSVKNNHIDGYAKPFLQDVEMYDPEQDKDKALARKLYEAIISGVLDLFQSKQTDEVATKTDVSGPVENPKASTLQILEKLVQNAFFNAILPGFEEKRGTA
ncbi:MAG TPA: YhjD/YihY/BrkB family envelope integrity protein [Nitrospira sp.]|nr:YhjD/YihY/BrkB family envelope integrity protein [Nitrospira sp.]